jgi:hypothetical protein
MDTIARHPVSALLVVAIFVALPLHFGIRPPPPPAARVFAPVETDTPEVTAEGVGKPMILIGRVGQVSHGREPFLVLALGRREVVCLFRGTGVDASPIAAVRSGDSVVVEGVVESVGSDSVRLADCKLAPAPNP